ncbi:MAG: hypothetical protein H7125_15895, partial [Proteobacteria bacterium]|nr:hypothetical protein [Burkholderiales bacterium]
MIEAPHVAWPSAAGGWLLLGVVVVGVAGEAVPGFPGWLAGVCAWAAALPLWPRLGRRQRMLVVTMLLLGAGGIGWGFAHGQTGLLEKALTLNTMIIAMLVGVAFLPLVSVRAQSGEPALKRGRLALLRTIVGVHLFGSVINLTAALIAADRLRRHAPTGPADA